MNFVDITFADGFRREFSFAQPDDALTFGKRLAASGNVISVQLKMVGRPWQNLGVKK